MNIGEQILFLRKNRGITQEQLAQKVRYYESGRKQMGIRTVFAGYSVAT